MVKLRKGEGATNLESAILKTPTCTVNLPAESELVWGWIKITQLRTTVTKPTAGWLQIDNNILEYVIEWTSVYYVRSEKTTKLNSNINVSLRDCPMSQREHWGALRGVSMVDERHTDVKPSTHKLTPRNVFEFQCLLLAAITNVS